MLLNNVAGVSNRSLWLFNGNAVDSYASLSGDRLLKVASANTAVTFQAANTIQIVATEGGPSQPQGGGDCVLIITQLQ